MTNDLKKPTEDVALPADARRWRAICRRHGAALTRLATESGSYHSDKKQAVLDAWADAAAAEVEAFDPDTWLREDVPARIAELEREAPTLAVALPGTVRKLSYSYDLLFDIKTTDQLQAEVDYLAHRLSGILNLCRDDGHPADHYVLTVLAGEARPPAADTPPSAKPLSWGDVLLSISWPEIKHNKADIP